MKYSIGILITLLSFCSFQMVYAENKIKTDDINKSEITIVQGNEAVEQPSPNNTITVGGIVDSKVDISQGHRSDNSPPKPKTLWSHFYTQIITGIVALFFGLLLWYLKRKFGETHE